MSDAIMVALITGGISIVGTIITVIGASQKQSSEFKKDIAVIDTKIQRMKEDISSHNNYAKMFSENVPAIKQHLTDVDRRLDNIERKTEP